jgi:hypothetical protein
MLTIKPLQSFRLCFCENLYRTTPQGDAARLPLRAGPPCPPPTPSLSLPPSLPRASPAPATEHDTDAASPVTDGPANSSTGAVVSEKEEEEEARVWAGAYTYTHTHTCIHIL